MPVNIIWIVMLITSLILCLINSPNSAINIMTESTANSVTLCITLLGIYILWMGIIQIMQDSGLADKLARVLKPVIRVLFGNVSDEASTLIAINLSCNILGLGNASTPAGLKAMKLLDNKSPHLSYPMMMLFCLNCCSLQIFPTTIISMRSNHDSINSSDIILPIIIVSAICFILCITMVRIFYRRHV